MMNESADIQSLRAEIEETCSNLHEKLLSRRSAAGPWRGRLSSSALSTATAVTALCLTDERRHRSLIRRGVEWLVANQNSDGGWGDTPISSGNISTTILCWAALALKPTDAPPVDAAIARAEKWLQHKVGGLEPEHIARALTLRYGDDRTFLIPILSVCAMTGRLGEGRAAWRRVEALPFELAACPHQWFKWLQLPVVSYALPALIALGQVRHFCLPTRNPISYVLRQATRRKTLRILQEIQPESGGFLEAVPLTAFVVMSLAYMGQKQHPVVEKGIAFLQNSVRTDGSWAIDVDLATWVTTLVMNAAPTDSPEMSLLSKPQRQAILDWLLGQQYREEHPFTHSAPGGWGWTDLPGAVPDADDTAGALLALAQADHAAPEIIQAAENGVRWLLSLQNRDGGIPTFCRGWGRLAFDRSSADITAHALRAFAAWRPRLSPAYGDKIEKAMKKAVRYLLHMQRADGAWTPLWFGNEHAPKDGNPTYGVSRVLMAFVALLQHHAERIAPSLDRGVQWLLKAQNRDGGWGGDKDVPSSIEETALAVDALARVLSEHRRRKRLDPAAEKEISEAVHAGALWLIRETKKGDELPPAPIGFYFASLWYYEELYPAVFSLSALNQVKTLIPRDENRG